VEKFRISGEKEEYSEYDTVRNIVSFAQSLSSTADKVTMGCDESPRYPIEILVDHGDDYEDTAILIAALLHETGYGVVLLQLPDHMAIGVKRSGTFPATITPITGSGIIILKQPQPDGISGKFPRNMKVVN